MITYKLAGRDWTFDEVPNECPLCHYAMDPRFLTGVIREAQPMGRAVIELIFQCPRKDCLHAFIGRYDGYYDRNVNDHTLFLRASTPFNAVLPEQPEDVAALSPQFVAIYGEASIAEARDLKQVAGCGYRKALEFLIKDFCVAENPKEEAAIKSQALGKVIEERIAEPTIKAMAKRATWLGNDETHYVRVGGEKDITDLKALINLTVNWINTHLLTKKYVENMPEGGKKGA